MSDKTKPKEPTKFFGLTIGKKNAQTGVGSITEEEKEAFQYVPTIPVINVVPNSVFEKYQVKGVLRKLIMIGLVIAVIIGGVWAGGQYLIGQQNAKATQLLQEQAELQAQTSALQPYLNYQNAVAEKRTTLYGVTANDINLGAVYAAFLIATAEHSVQLPQMGFGVAQGQASGCVSEPYATDPNKPAVIGCLSLQGTASSYDQVNDFLNFLTDYSDCPTNPTRDTPGSGGCFVDMFLKSFAQNVDESGVASVSFEASIAFTKYFYTDKYKNLSIPLEELLLYGPNGAPICAEAVDGAEPECVESTTTPTNAPPVVPTPTRTPTPTPTPTETPDPIETPTSGETPEPTDVPTPTPTETGEPN